MLDLNGNTLSVNSNFDVFDTSGTLTIKNGMVAGYNSSSNDKSMAAMDNLAGTTLTVEQEEGQTAALIGRCGIQNAGTAIVYNGTVESYNPNAYYGCAGSELTVYDGTFTSSGGSSGMGHSISTEGNVTIYGGTFYAVGSSGAGDNYMNTIGVFYDAVLTIKPTARKAVAVTSKIDYAVANRYGAKANIYLHYDGGADCRTDSGRDPAAG